MNRMTGSVFDRRGPLRAILIACPFIAVLGVVSIAAADHEPAAVELAHRIDARLTKLWESEQVQPAAVIDDAGFLRRLTLDLHGRIPTAAEVREFLADDSRDKRRKLVFRLTQEAAFSRHLGLFLRREWMPQTDVEPHDYLAGAAADWITGQLRNNAPYDRIVFDLIVAQASGSARENGLSQVFLRANSYQPALLAANSARSFLGINLDCAQCHDHPFARWSRDDFWQTAAFFVRPPAETNGTAWKLTITPPETDRRLEPAFLTSEPIRWPDTTDETTGRRLFADWVTSPDNPYFARNATNRLWRHFFGAGLIEPVDDIVGGRCIDEELLDLLAESFRQDGYDLRTLIRGIVLSQAYQRSSESRPGLEAAAAERALFARARVRGLTGEQLYDSLRIAAGFSVLREDVDPPQALLERKKFAERFRLQPKGGTERSILQSLTLMNGSLTAALTDPQTSPTLIAVADAPFLGPREKVDALFLSVLSRHSTDDELQLLAPLARSSDGVTDIFWALLNSVEFNTNH